MAGGYRILKAINLTRKTMSEVIKIGEGLISRMNIPQLPPKEIKNIEDLISEVREITPKKVSPYICVSEKWIDYLELFK